MKRFTINVEIHDSVETHAVVIHGSDAWELSELVKAGKSGCTPIDHPGPRWSGYVHKLRKLGIQIETIHEQHGGQFAGRHARYVLRSIVQIVSTNELEAA